MYEQFFWGTVMLTPALGDEEFDETFRNGDTCYCLSSGMASRRVRSCITTVRRVYLELDNGKLRGAGSDVLRSSAKIDRTVSERHKQTHAAFQRGHQVKASTL